MRNIFLRTLLISGTVMVAAQQSSADQLPNFNIQPPIWNSNQAPIAWGDCIPVPINSIPYPQNNFSMGAPSPMIFPFPQPSQLPMNMGPNNAPMMPPIISEQPIILPPPSPFFNAAPSPIPMAPVACDDSSNKKLQALQARYNQASALSKQKFLEINQALSDANNQMADARIIINTLSKEKESSKTNNLGAVTEFKKQLATLDNTNKTLQAKLSTLESGAGAQARKITSLNQSATELVAIQSAYKARNDENVELKKKLNDLDNTHKSLLTKLSAANTNAGAQARKLTALNQASTELVGLKSAYQARNNENAELKKKLAEIDGAYKTLQAQLSTSKSEAGAQARKLTALSQTSSELPALKSAYKAKNEESLGLKKEVTSLNSKLSALQVQATLKGAQDSDIIKTLKKKLASIDDANKTLKAQLGTFETNAGSQARKLTALGQSATELTSLKSAYDARNTENSALKAKLKARSEEANSCKFEVADLKKGVANTDNQRKSLLAQIASLENTSSSQARKITALTATTLELEGLKSAYKDLSSKKVELTSKLSAATADTDKDGVLNNADKCPFSVAGAEVNAMGCLADADNDGVVDSKDNCKSSPIGSHVNEKGCPKITDTDGDNVADANDLCPSTPAGATVNEFGCEPTENITLEGVNFSTGSARLTASSLPILSAAAATLNKNPKLNIEISGYTDNQGMGYINKRLSQRRANTVMIQLIKEGVDANRLTAKGYGEKNPVASNTTESGRATNRRVELKIRN